MRSDVRQIASHQIVHRYHLMPLGYQAIYHVAANKTGPAGDKNSHFLPICEDEETGRRGDEATGGFFAQSPRLPVAPSLRSSSPDSSIFKSRFFDRLWV